MQRMCIPSQGRNAQSLLTEMAAFADEDVDYRGGRTWSLVYFVDDKHSKLLKDAYNLYFSTNALNPMAFRSLRKMEAEVVQMTASLLNGPDSCVGSMTSGGTESILLAVKACRDRARRRWPWIRRPNIVVPATIHVAFDKAGHYFGLEVRRGAVKPNGQADLRTLKRLINRNTILVGASAPQYPHGVVDPIGDIAAIAARKGLPMHVDACFGGFIQPWLEKLGVDMPCFDFRVPGVTSISADVHKYGYAAKGASTVLYRDMSYMRHQFFISTGWTGGIYASPTIAGTRPGGGIAAGWASLMHMGEDGYVDLAEKAWQGAEKLRAGIGRIEGLRLLGLPHSTIVTYASTRDNVDLFAVADQMQERGWSVDRQQLPPSVHCTVNANNCPVIDQYLSDLAECVARVIAHPELAASGEAAIYGMMSKVPFRGLVDHGVREMMESMYGPDGEIPDLGERGGKGGLMGLMDKYGPGAVDLLDRVGRRLRQR